MGVHYISVASITCSGLIGALLVVLLGYLDGIWMGFEGLEGL